MNVASTKKPGNIMSAFSANVRLSEKFKNLKDLIKPNKLEESWARLIKTFDEEIQVIKSKGPNIIPQVNFEDIRANNGKFPENKIEEIKKRGCIVIRNVISRELALQYKADVKEYIANNRNHIVGYPENDPQIWEVYWSKSQAAARSHPNFYETACAVNKLWHAEEGTDIDLTKNLTYCDRLRIRKPQNVSFSLGEHIDGGSVERWEDPEYRKCYQNILNGSWEQHDPYNATHRVNANMDLYNCDGGCSMFRSFQGWMSLSHVQSGGGTLRVCPLIKLTSSYIILRPFLADLIDTPDMAGAIPGSQQHITKDLHPHIVEAMVSIPNMAPGDCIFWHCDEVHAVDKVCNNVEDSSVFYMPASPICAKNTEYLRRQKYAFQKGTSPPDFPLNNCEENLKDRATETDLTELGKQGMGF